ncbi:hypothetical protein [Mucilaginibacter sp.]|uniref:hypothetical protein n=1 Tax=Mucilaginibacter sp. TaxID=1882438 RepID=UPI00284D0ACD|nr:hypothetical protein [Mucilaginibacter sp.]MDR3694011.1 hypothetical protein [Mucilaginibacter sp.]
MKKVSKLLALAFTAAALFLTSSVKAQTTPPNAWRLGIGIEGGIPTGNLKDFSKFDLGGTARLQYGLSKDVALTLTSGYYNFFARSSSATIDGITYTTKPSDLGVVPVKAGIKAFFAGGLYVGAEAGAGFETDYAKNTKLILSPGLGYATKNLDVGVRYENFSGSGDSYGLVGLRIAYGFGL